MYDAYTGDIYISLLSLTVNFFFPKFIYFHPRDFAPDCPGFLWHFIEDLNVIPVFTPLGLNYLINQNSGYQVCNYADKPDLFAKELIKTIENSLSLKTPSLRVPYPLGLLGGYGFDVLAKVSGKKLPVSSVRVKKFCATTQFDATKAHENGFQAPYSLEEGLAKTLNYEFRD